MTGKEESDRTHSAPGGSTAFERLVAFLRHAKASFKVLEHPECRTADESTAIRAAAGDRESVGAKALLARVSADGSYRLLVLHANHRLDNRVLRKRLGEFRFATAQELAAATDGLEHGMVPPFGRAVFPKIETLYVDDALRAVKDVAFNAACLTRSVVMPATEYLRVCGADELFTFSRPPPPPPKVEQDP